MYTQLGVLTKGTVIEVNVSELGLVTTGGKAVWGKYAQVTNNPENDGCINALLRKLLVPVLSSVLLTHSVSGLIPHCIINFITAFPCCSLCLSVLATIAARDLNLALGADSKHRWPATSTQPRQRTFHLAWPILFSANVLPGISE